MSVCMKFPRALLSVRIAGLAGLLISPLAQADFAVAGFELVHTVPVDTALGTADLRQPGPVWIELFDGAKSRIDIGQFYAADHPGSVLGTVIEHLEAAGKRGVKIRFLLEEKGLKLSDPATLERLRAIPNLTFRVLPYAQVSGGIIHAKYMVVDGKQAFVGSQNFDWRSLEHIHETGLRISDESTVAQVQAIFEQDWQAQAAVAANQPVPLPAPASRRYAAAITWWPARNATTRPAWATRNRSCRACWPKRRTKYGCNCWTMRRCPTGLTGPGPITR